jgi:hypothetical protein
MIPREWECMAMSDEVIHHAMRGDHNEQVLNDPPTPKLDSSPM